MSRQLRMIQEGKERLSRLAPAWNLFLDLIYPPRCGGCDKRGTLLCDDCRSSIALPGESDLAVPEIDLLLYAGSFDGPLRRAIHNFKYENDTPLAKPLAGLLTAALGKRLSTTWQRDELPVLVPVPLHSTRRHERGYNQAELLAHQLSRETGLPVDHGLARIRETRSQVGLHPDERKANVAGAFEWQHDTAPPAAVLVDDVCTTGATLAECAAVLRLKGTRRVYAVTVARAIGMGLPKNA